MEQKKFKVGDEVIIRGMIKNIGPSDQGEMADVECVFGGDNWCFLNELTPATLEQAADAKELSNCPFCGTHHLLTHTVDPIRVECTGCGAKGPIAGGETRAQRLWNYRFVGMKESQ